MNSKVNLLNSNSTSDKSPWVNVMIFLRDINMQGELVTKAGLCSWPVTHSSSTHSLSPAAHPVKLSLIPCHSDLCQATVTFGGQGFHAVHTRIVYLFVSVSVCCCLSSLLVSSAPNTPLVSESDVLYFYSPPLAAFFSTIHWQWGVGLHLSTDPLSPFWNFLETFSLALLF